jgi:branched-chain amino acid aminotransferase
MDARVYINGGITDQENAKISVFDRGFLYGDSIYEVIRTYQRIPFMLDEHLVRLNASAEGLAIQMPPNISAAISEVVQDFSNPECYLRVVVTRGEGPINLSMADTPKSNLIIIAKDIHLPPAHLYEEGATLAIVSVRRNSPNALNPSIKSGNYLNNILALKEANDLGAYEAIMLDQAGNIAEGASSNIFVSSKGVLYTPPVETGILEGITRATVLKIAQQEKIEVQEVRLAPKDIYAADEVFITSSIREILPVKKVDHATFNVPGRITTVIQQGYRQEVDLVCNAKKM